MPLRVWRTDEITPLSPHPNDPARQTKKRASPASEVQGSEFLTIFTLTVPEGTPSQDVDATLTREADRARELAGQGHLLRLWKLPDQGRSLGLWHAHDTAGMQEILASLPLAAWMGVQTTPLTLHPSDPALTSSLANS